jgi:uncharacterized protein (TIGR03067 family)
MTPTLLAVIAATLLAADPPKANGKTDTEKIQGVWTVVGGEVGGKPLKDAQATLTFEGNDVYFTRRDGLTNHATYTLDPTKTPKQTDWKSAGNTILGIYELDGEQLTVCITSTSERPKEFKAPDEKTTLFKLKYARPVPDPNDPSLKPEFAKVKGKWDVVSAEEDGKAAPADKIKGAYISFDANKITIVDPDQKFEGKFVLVPSEKPRQMNVRRIKGDRIETAVGIYDLDGDSLTLCLASEGADRPKEFKSGRNIVLIKLRRAKP